MTDEVIETAAPEYPKHTEWADFDIVNGKVAVMKLNKPYTEYDVSFEDHFNGSDEYKTEERYALYTACAIECNKTAANIRLTAGKTATRCEKLPILRKSTTRV